MKIEPYLNFDGKCEEAFRFYEKALGGRIEGMIPFEGTPMGEHLPPGFGKKVMHARLVVGDQGIMGSDAPPDRFQKPQGFSVSLQIDKSAEAERIFAALSENGKVDMPIQQTFWAYRFGMLVDQYGIAWMINNEKQS